VADRGPLVGLGKRLAADEALGRVVGINGATLAVPAAAQAIALAGLAELAEGTIVAVTATLAEAERLHEDLVCLMGVVEDPDEPGSLTGDAMLLPAWDTLPLERVSPEIAAMGQRLAVRWRLAGDRPPRVVVAPVRALLQRLAPDAGSPIVVRPGDRVDIEELMSDLIAAGYRREHQVEHRGEVAVRGGIIDVFGSTAAGPVRIDLFGDEVDRLTLFDVADQRSSAAVEAAWFFGCREMVVDESMAEAAHGLATREPWTAPVLSRFEVGAFFDGMEGWLGAVSSTEVLMTDLLGESDTVALLEPRRLRDRAVELEEEESALVSALVTTWSGDAGAVERDDLVLHLGFDRLLAKSVAATLLAPTAADSPRTPQIATRGIEQVIGDSSRLALLLGGLASEGMTVIALGAQEASARRLAEVLVAEHLDVKVVAEAPSLAGVCVAASALSRGVILPDAGLALLAEPDITGRRVPHRKARPQQRVVDGFFDDLAPGSYVVHRQHGVARFSGVTTRVVAGTTRDYLILEFRDAKLYLPVDQIDAITPYSGGESPNLSKMGGSDWQRTRSKARSAASEVAEELVELYRMRLLAEGRAFGPDTPWQAEMEAAFPFSETPDQRKAIDDVKADMEQPRPMDRLVCADVGFGKTEVAVRAAFKAVQEGCQVAILVPTTLLASQHHQTFTERFGGYPVNVALLSRFLTDAEATQVREGLASGAVDVVVGTHRLLSESIEFKNLGLLVVDEEQRFGVTHKESIKRMSEGVDVLTLTASPIPRTLEMALTGIRDLSMVTTPPVDRRPILTYVGESDDRATAEAIRRELLREGQVFYVHNRVADIDAAARRIRDLVPEARVLVAHGQMDEGTLESVVMRFADREADVLVCTTIVESGIDMPSVNTLIVSRADLLGLGQLHQLRGRVGRSGQRAYAYLFHPADTVLSETAYERLRTIGENTDLGSGFKIAMRDLEIRGAGNLLGRDQSGHVAAVGYDLYVQMVAEAVSEARGVVPPPPVSLSIDVPGDAHLPATYVEQEDARLEAYRRLSGTQTDVDVDDVAAEWVDRYGPLPDAAQGLIDLARLRVTCLRLGINELSVLPARPGLRSVPLARISPLTLPISAQIRVRRLLGERAYDEASKMLKVELTARRSAPSELRSLLDDLVPPEDPAPLSVDSAG
jgi:transcription-repair coupling factor (superfamily II helicase)